MQTFGTVLILLLSQGGSDSESIRTRLQLEAQEQEMNRLESKMTTGAKLLADKDSRLRQLEFSLLDNNAVCHYVLVVCFYFLGRLRRVDLIIWVSCPYVRPSVYVRPQKVFPIPMKFGRG